MTIQGAIEELQNLLKVDDIPFYYKGGIEKVIETIQMEIAEQTEPNYSEKPNNCDTCKWGEWYRKGYDITMMDDECGGCCSWNNKWAPKDEPQTEEWYTFQDEQEYNARHGKE